MNAIDYWYKKYLSEKEKSKNTVEWLLLHMPFGEVSKELRDEVIEDFKKYIEG